MADVEKVEFEFPDEKDVAEEKANADLDKTEAAKEDSEIEVVDDTPPADRGRRPSDEPPREFNDDELAKYDESVKSRIRHFTKGYHDERRAKEAALREREEALRIAQAVVEENKKLKGSLGQNQAVMLDNFKKLAATDLEKAKSKYKEAYESGDADAVADAQAALTAATVRFDRVQNLKPQALQPKENDVQPEQEIVQPAARPVVVDRKAQDWQDKNQWFGKDEEMTSFALGLHTKLVNSGVDPNTDEYYDRLNTRLRQVFPDAFESEKTVDAPTPRPAKSNVAPATRSTAPKKIVLTQTQVNIAKKLGVPLELYARKVAEEMRK
jgi:hypothetical protein